MQNTHAYVFFLFCAAENWAVEGAVAQATCIRGVWTGAHVCGSHDIPGVWHCHPVWLLQGLSQGGGLGEMPPCPGTTWTEGEQHPTLPSLCLSQSCTHSLSSQNQNQKNQKGFYSPWMFAQTRNLPQRISLTHSHFLSFSLSLYLTLSLSVCLSVSLSFFLWLSLSPSEHIVSIKYSGGKLLNILGRWSKTHFAPALFQCRKMLLWMSGCSKQSFISLPPPCLSLILWCCGWKWGHRGDYLFKT